MELRQLRYFVTLAEELHFGRAAEREHIVQSALSQQVQRLERELGVRLLERSTHHVGLTAAGAVFLVEARQILARVDRAAAVARSATGAAPALRVGIIDASYDSMPQILHEVQARYPALVIHQVEVGVPEQYQQLIDGRLDVGIGRAALAPPQVSSLLFRQDPLGVLVPPSHRFAGLDAIPVAVLAEEPLLLAEEVQAPEFNQFTVEMCRAADFTPTVYGGTVESIRAAADLVAQGRCLYCVPSSCIAALPGTIWRPLTEPASYYPWSVLWRAAETSDHVHALVSCARTMSRRLGWLVTTDQTLPATSASRSARPDGGGVALADQVVAVLADGGGLAVGLGLPAAGLAPAAGDAARAGQQ
jgi:DNA-binding transcriptional LysR family regulator